MQKIGLFIVVVFGLIFTGCVKQEPKPIYNEAQSSKAIKFNGKYKGIGCNKAVITIDLKDLEYIGNIQTFMGYSAKFNGFVKFDDKNNPYLKGIVTHHKGGYKGYYKINLLENNKLIFEYKDNYGCGGNYKLSKVVH